MLFTQFKLAILSHSTRYRTRLCYCLYLFRYKPWTNSIYETRWVIRSVATLSNQFMV